MSAHHAPKSLARSSWLLGGLIEASGAVLAVACVLGWTAFQSATQGNSLNVFLWGETYTSMLRPPAGEFLFGVALVVFGAIMAKMGPRARTWAGFRFSSRRRTFNEGRFANAYPQRRLGRRMFGLGIPALLTGALMLVVWAAGRTELRDAGMDPNLGAILGLVGGLVASICAFLAIALGFTAWTRAPSEEETRRAELAEFAASQPAVPAPPPMPGRTPPMPAPPGAPA